MNIPIKRWLLLTHRWLGIGLCLFFLSWFVSGMVMMYVGYPKLTHAERLHHLPTLDADAPLLSPRQAFGMAGIDGSVSDLRLTASRAGQPIYTALLQSGPDDAETAVAVDARTGRRLPPATQDVVLASARTYLHNEGHPTSNSAPASRPDQAEPALTYEGTIDEDPHTHSRSLDPYRPLHKVQLPDADRTLLYIADTTGEVVRDAPHTERTLDYVGTWLHWLYMFRGGSFDAWWPTIIIWLATIGVLVALTGSIVGILRWRFSRPYRSGSRSPFQPGVMRWHHLVGLFFALTTLTWIFSGLMSMRPWGLFKSPHAALETESISSLQMDPAQAPMIPHVLLESAHRDGLGDVRELQWRTILGKPTVLALGATGTPHVLDAITGKPTRVEARDLTAALNALTPDHPPRIEQLKEYDFYYYTRADHTMMGGGDPQPLPFWRVQFDDPDQTWVQLDPATGTVLNTLNQHKRVERWLFFLMHSWDLVPLLHRRPLWDIFMLVLAVGGLALSATGIWIGTKRLGIKTRRRKLLNRKDQTAQ